MTNLSEYKELLKEVEEINPEKDLPYGQEWAMRRSKQDGTHTTESDCKPAEQAGKQDNG